MNCNIKEMEARKRVLEQIRLDREARKLTGQLLPSQSTAVNSPLPVVNKASSAKDDGFCQIQVRLLNGAVIREKFKVSLALA